MHLRVAICVTAICLGLAGCGTRYQEMGFTGGVAAERVTADTVRRPVVSAFGQAGHRADIAE
jgi:hypothetical protein